MLEVRRHERRHMLVDLEICDQDTDRCLGRIEDIAVQGIRLSGNESLEVHDTLNFEMVLPSSGGDACREVLTARVMWCEESASAGCYESGLELLDLSDQQVDMLKRFMAQNAYENRWQDIARDMR